MLSRPTLVRWTAGALHRSGLIRPLARAIGVAARPRAFQILSYHRVNDDEDPFFGSVPTRVFEQHMSYIAGTYRVLTVEELVERTRRGTLPPNALAITFDDGYRDNLTHAAPILLRLGLPATIFVATGLIGTAEIPWFDRLAMAFKTTPETSVLTPWGQVLSLASSRDRLDALAQVLAQFKRQPDDEMRQMLDGLLAALRVNDRTNFKDLMLTWDDVNALAGLGFSIGAHTVHHPILSRVSLERARTEIEGSRTMIESACGPVPTAFAYPNGTADDYTNAIKNLVREAGFSCGVTTRFGLNCAATCPYELRRGGPWEHHLPTFALKLAGYRLALQ
jgi:peptidoglycan/xylan/chitin deacetylase (PgdA/CDA1 family)